MVKGGENFADDPLALFDVDRYWTGALEGHRRSGSDREATRDPTDPLDLNFGEPFDVTRRALMPKGWFPELADPIAGDADDAIEIALGNEIVRWLMSGILHGEQASTYLAGQLRTSLGDPAERAFADNQSREEERHVAAVTRYIAARWGRPYSIGRALGRFFGQLMGCKEPAPKIVGMSLLLEGFAMAAFSNIRAHTHDGALKTLMTYLLRDETAHHKFGLRWLEGHVPEMTAAERNGLSDWALRGFTALCVNLVSARERKIVYQRFGLDWRQVRESVQYARQGAEPASVLGGSADPILVMANALDQSAILTAGARARLSPWLGRPARH